MTLDDLMAPLTIDQAKATVYAVLTQLGAPTTSWRPNAVVRTVVFVVAVILAGVSVVAVAIAKLGFREYATGDWLTVNARQQYGVDRIGATFAPGVVTLVNAAGGDYPTDPEDLVVFNNNPLSPAYGKAFKNVAAFHLHALETLDVPIVAVEAGGASTSIPGDIQGFSTPLSGVTCTNAAAVVGLDAESDDELRDREDETIDATSANGPAGAYAAAAKAAVRAADGSRVGVTRVRTNATSIAGQVFVTVASATGAISGTAGIPATDLGAVNKRIQETCVPLGVAACTVQSATEQPVDVTYEVWIYTSASMTDIEVRAAIAAALTQWFASRPISGDVIPPATSGYVYQNMVEKAVGSASPYILKVVVTAPAADTALAELDVAVLGTVTCTAVHQVEPAP